MAGLLDWFKTRRESTVIRKTQEHAAKVNQVVHEAHLCISLAFQGKDPTNAIKRVEQIEHEADILRREIFSILTTGELSQPNEREDLMHIVKRMDNVANNANASIRRFSLLLMKDFPHELQTLVLKMLSLALECSDMLKKCTELLGRVDISETLRLTNLISEREHEVDLLNAEVKNFLIHCNITTNPFEAIVIHEFIERIENIADACEDTADIVKLIALRGHGR